MSEQRVAVERLHVGDTVRAVLIGPEGTVIDADRRGWTIVKYSRGTMPYRRYQDALFLIKEARP